MVQSTLTLLEVDLVRSSCACVAAILAASPESAFSKDAGESLLCARDSKRLTGTGQGVVGLPSTARRIPWRRFGRRRHDELGKF